MAAEGLAIIHGRKALSEKGMEGGKASFPRHVFSWYIVGVDGREAAGERMARRFMMNSRSFKDGGMR